MAVLFIYFDQSVQEINSNQKIENISYGKRKKTCGRKHKIAVIFIKPLGVPIFNKLWRLCNKIKGNQKKHKDKGVISQFHIIS